MAGTPEPTWGVSNAKNGRQDRDRTRTRTKAGRTQYAGAVLYSSAPTGNVAPCDLMSPRSSRSRQRALNDRLGATD